MRPGTVSVLTPEHDELITRIIGCAIRVHKELGPGFLERIYATALAFEFDEAGIAFEREGRHSSLSWLVDFFFFFFFVAFKFSCSSGHDPDRTKNRTEKTTNQTNHVLLLKDGIRRIVV